MPQRLVFFILILLLLFSSSHLGASSLPTNGITVFFSPGDECGKMILEKIGEAEKSIELAMYYVTSRPLSGALISAARRGVRVRVFLDGESAREYYSKAGFLKKNGILVKLEKGHGLMHNKFCIIDGEWVITGSYNWTTSADLQNDENVILINSKEIARIYRVQFEKYWQGDYPDKAYYINKSTLRKAGSE